MHKKESLLRVCGSEKNRWWTLNIPNSRLFYSTRKFQFIGDSDWTVAALLLSKFCPKSFVGRGGDLEQIVILVPIYIMVFESLLLHFKFKLVISRNVFIQYSDFKSLKGNLLYFSLCSQGAISINGFERQVWEIPIFFYKCSWMNESSLLSFEFWKKMRRKPFVSREFFILRRLQIVWIGYRYIMVSAGAVALATVSSLLSLSLVAFILAVVFLHYRHWKYSHIPGPKRRRFVHWKKSKFLYFLYSGLLLTY